jgi:hypothetical protein
MAGTAAVEHGPPGREIPSAGAHSGPRGGSHRFDVSCPQQPPIPAGSDVTEPVGHGVGPACVFEVEKAARS